MLTVILFETKGIINQQFIQRIKLNKMLIIIKLLISCGLLELILALSEYGGNYY